MDYAFFVLMILSLLAILAGMIRPTWVIRWGNKRTRPMALLVYSVIFLVFTVLFISSIKPPQAAVATAGPQAPALPVPSTQQNGKAAYCAWVKDQKAMAQDLDKVFGFDPEHGRQPGEVVTLEKDVVGTANPRSKGVPASGPVVKYFAGTKIKILERHFYGELSSDLLYKVEGEGATLENGKMAKGVVTGFVEPVVIKLASDDYKAFSGKYFERKRELEAGLKAKHPQAFEEAVQQQALAEDWWAKCGK